MKDRSPRPTAHGPRIIEDYDGKRSTQVYITNGSDQDIIPH
ncbi:uncharacterized protein G2W53_043715 [Senna tora]|uniref:Uncharacterized protein n=1 Tax=Senna tora TaxID=362788 RepID=A0A834W574_9FABA|nr:uncharacterized protein G2W53_043715 [Senna tora]